MFSINILAIKSFIFRLSILLLDKYLNAIGIEDPFAIPWSLNAQIVFHPEKFKYNKKGKFYIYRANLKDFYYAGANGFVIRRKEFFDAGGYVKPLSVRGHARFSYRL